MIMRALVLFVMLLVVLIRPTAGQVPDDALADPKTANLDPRLPDQLRLFLPYISMDARNKLVAGTHDVADVLKEITDLKEQQETGFDAHPTLLRCKREIVSFLVRSRDTLTPALKDVHPPSIPVTADTEPEVAVVVLLLQGYIEAMKQSEIRNWQTEWDAKCRAAYQDVLQLVRLTSTGMPVPEPPVRIEHSFERNQWVYLRAVNISRKDLSNVTLAVRLETIDGQAQDHYYYYASWPQNKSFVLRPAADWLHVDGEATTKAQFEVISDQVRSDGLVNRIDDNIPTAGDKLLREYGAQVRTGRRLKMVIGRLGAMESALQPYRELAKLRAELFKEAQDRFKAAVARLDEQIKAETEARGKLQEKKRKAKNNDEKKGVDSKITAIDLRIKQLNDQHAALMAGKI